jgi:hypothetical protein
VTDGQAVELIKDNDGNEITNEIELPGIEKLHLVFGFEYGHGTSIPLCLTELLNLV